MKLLLSWTDTDIDINMDPNHMFDTIPTISGVYIFSTQIDDGTHQAIYVGEAKNLKERNNGRFLRDDENGKLKRHFDGKLNMTFFWAGVLEEKLCGVESYLIEIFPKLYNEKKPQAMPIPCTLPPKLNNVVEPLSEILKSTLKKFKNDQSSSYDS
jgi:hypothetical protein